MLDLSWIFTITAFTVFDMVKFFMVGIIVGMAILAKALQR